MARSTGKREKKYSHNGCQECKRRKIKCDEGKPLCWHCDRLRKRCQYENKKNDALHVGKVSLKPSGAQNGCHDRLSDPETSPLSRLIYYSGSTTPLDQDMVEEVHDSQTISGVSLLANDLSGLISMNLDELTTIAEPTASPYSMSNGIMLSNFPSSNDKTFQTNVPMNYISLMGQNHFYMKEFYNDFSHIISPFQANVDGVSINPVRDILMIYARDSHYLLYALLACGARTSHRKTSLPEDQSNYKVYLRHCLDSLTTAMDQDITAELDSILLTILVLTCDNASNKSQAWRTHLRGAKDLLLKTSHGGSVQKCDSKTFLLCRSWYSSIEILAGLVSPNGGTLKSSEELDLLILPNDIEEANALRELNIVSPEGFSLFHGYSMKLVIILKNLIKLFREEGTSRQDYNTMIDLIASLRMQLDFCVIDKTGIIPETHKYYPKDINHLDLPNNIGVISIDGRKIAFSWQDISNRSYVLAALITIFTKLLNMSKESEIVQGMVRDLLDTAFFLDGPGYSSKSYCSFLLQWPMLVAGSNSVQEADRIKVETFFRLLAELGSGSAGFVLARLRRIWSQRSPSEAESPGEVDIVTY